MSGLIAEYLSVWLGENNPSLRKNNRKHFSHIKWEVQYRNTVDYGKLRQRFSGQIIPGLEQGKFNDLKFLRISDCRLIEGVTSLKYVTEHNEYILEAEGYTYHFSKIEEELIPIYSSYLRKAKNKMRYGNTIDNNSGLEGIDFEGIDTEGLHVQGEPSDPPLRYEGRAYGKKKPWDKDSNPYAHPTCEKYGSWATRENPCGEIGMGGHILDGLSYSINKKTTNKGKTNMKNLKTDAKDSIALAADLAKGRLALSTVHSFITRILPVKFSWFARVTKQDQKVMNSPYTKLAAAAVAHAIASSAGYSKVTKVTKLAQDAALVDVAALIPLEKLVAQLTDLATDELEKS